MVGLRPPVGVLRFDNTDLNVAKRAVERYSCIDDDLSSVCAQTQWTMGVARGDWRVHRPPLTPS